MPENVNKYNSKLTEDILTFYKALEYIKNLGNGNSVLSQKSPKQTQVIKGLKKMYKMKLPVYHSAYKTFLEDPSSSTLNVKKKIGKYFF